MVAITLRVDLSPLRPRPPRALPSANSEEGCCCGFSTRSGAPKVLSDSMEEVAGARGCRLDGTGRALVPLTGFEGWHSGFTEVDSGKIGSLLLRRRPPPPPRVCALPIALHFSSPHFLLFVFVLRVAAMTAAIKSSTTTRRRHEAAELVEGAPRRYTHTHRYIYSPPKRSHSTHADGEGRGDGRKRCVGGRRRCVCVGGSRVEASASHNDSHSSPPHEQTEMKEEEGKQTALEGAGEQDTHTHTHTTHQTAITVT